MPLSCGVPRGFSSGATEGVLAALDAAPASPPVTVATGTVDAAEIECGCGGMLPMPMLDADVVDLIDVDIVLLAVECPRSRPYDDARLVACCVCGVDERLATLSAVL